MKNILSKVFLLCLLVFLTFSTKKVNAQYYVETTKFSRYAAKYPNSTNYRYDAVNRLILYTTPFNRDSVAIASYEYDANGNRTNVTSLLFYVNKKNRSQYLCDTKIKPEDFAAFLKKAFDQLDQE